MNLYEMEIALIDGFTLTYVDLEDYTQCYISYVGADTVLHTRDTVFGEVQEYHQMSSLLVDLDQNNDTSVEIFTPQ